MKRTSAGRLLLGVVGASLVAVGVRAAQLAELPAGANRELVARTCMACHDLQMVFDTGGLSRADWEGVLDEMKSYGLNVEPGEQALIVEYLATYLPPRPR